MRTKKDRIKFIRCINCGEKMRKETLLSDISPFEWGSWLYFSIRTYNSNFYKFHDKVHMGLIVENLKFQSNYVVYDFWDGWNNAKVEWNKGNGNRLLLKIESKMYKDKSKVKMDRYLI
jgi:hypothetical protein